MARQLSLFSEAPAPPPPAPAVPAPAQSHFDWATIDRCGAAARAEGRRLFMDPFDNYSLYGPGVDDYERYHGLDALCAALGIDNQAC